MIKVLVVDDDKMARRGIIAEMPWDLFGMQVVGEANNGERALEFLKNEAVDLLITDLAMPVMSGLDLMRQVQQLYPHIWFVVLTFHQDFELIQEALRIGAIDYIAKTQIEHAKMEDVLGRISERIGRNRLSSFQAPVTVPAGQSIDAASMLVFIAVDGQQIDFSLLSGCPFLLGKPMQEISLGMWTVLLEQEMFDEAVAGMKADLIERGLNKQVAIIEINDLQGADKENLRKRLLLYKERSFFYEYENPVFYYTFTADRLNTEYPGWTDEELRTNREAWSSLQWIVQVNVFDELLQEIGKARPSVAQLESIFYTAKNNWLRIVPEEVVNMTDMPGSRSYWQEWTSWLNGVRGRLRGVVIKSSYSDEISNSIMKTVDYINQHLDSDLRHSDLAREANMSKGYFSQCFKEIVGRTFHDYIRDARIENARLLLVQTKQPIYRVAEQCGYPNEKYFSRVFRERMGMLPSEYRQETAKV
ncbi:response regulator transcription factor [Paenibacillus contaminans]|uniref:DNA-binding response regulator n=1 Tax=Paenibacillus contaminans TaxID=450362 RepID=A0A329N0G4_9BACL|nr:helix-turn-helix domain-containing protein [Paenibacillus contaminans]RAV23137.1 DNA-binding response regulator [Paenibacillus contaminans]